MNAASSKVSSYLYGDVPRGGNGKIGEVQYHSPWLPSFEQYPGSQRFLEKKGLRSRHEV